MHVSSVLVNGEISLHFGCPIIHQHFNCAKGFFKIEHFSCDLQALGARGVQFKARVTPELVDALKIQNFEKAATNFTKGFIFTFND
jgi:hypothetical protein